MTRAPLRFLVTLLVLWVGVRAAILLPSWPGGPTPVPLATAAAAERPRAASPFVLPAVPPLPAAMSASHAPLPAVARAIFPPDGRFRSNGAAVLPLAFALPTRASLRFLGASVVHLDQPETLPVPVFGEAASRRAGFDASRLSVSAWLLVRDEGGAALAPGGTLGGSQAGARAVYALGGGFSLSGRAYLPLPAKLRRGACGGRRLAAFRLPARQSARRAPPAAGPGRTRGLRAHGLWRRQPQPRSAAAASISTARPAWSGVQSRDLFADGALRLARRIGPVEIGAGAWGAAQPGAARLDAGPSLSWRLPVAGAALRLQADWRFRIAGDAAPRSGPALTLAADF